MLMKQKYIISQSRGGSSSNPLEEFEGGLVVAASWEPRSQAILDRVDLTKIKKVILIRYENKGATGVSGNVRNRIRSMCSKYRVSVTEESLGSVGESYAHYYNAVYSIVSEMARHGCGWTIDISSMPRRLWCSIVFLLDRLNLVRNVQFHYAHPFYVFVEDEYKRTYYEYTLGDWVLEDLPFAKISFGNGLYKKNIISIGFEYDKLKSIIYRHEADYNSIICASPGISDAYTQLAERTLERIRNVFEIRESDIHRIGLSDVETVFGVACNLIDENQDKDISLICAGNKLHSLALCLSSVCYSNVNFFVRVPKAYKENSTRSGGEFDLVRVENLFASRA